MAREIIISSVSELRETVADIMSMIDELEEINNEKEYDIRLCLRELLSNSLVYSGAGRVRLVYELSDGCFRFSVMDRGCGFDGKSAGRVCPDTMSESGRGIFLVRKLADDVRYNKKGTAVIVRFYY